MMKTTKLVDPEFREWVESTPKPDAAVFSTAIDTGDIAEFRRAAEVEGRKSTADQPVFTDVVFEDRVIAGHDGELSVRVYRPIDHSPELPLPALLYMHGGSFIFGSPTDAEYHTICSRIVERVECAVVSVDYRLAPEHPYPAATEDCYATLLWMADKAKTLGIDKNRIAVGGHSAGGCLAAAVALMARDRNGPALIYQLLIYPCLDDRDEVGNSFQAADPEMREIFRLMWKAYLGKDSQKEVSPYAVPARAKDLTGLPPAYILAADLDLLLDEAVAYALRLTRSDVSSELHVFPGAIHGFDIVLENATLSQRAVESYTSALSRAFG